MAVLLKSKTSNKLFHWKLIQEKHLQYLATVQRLTGTLLTRIFFDEFLLFYGNLNIYYADI